MKTPTGYRTLYRPKALRITLWSLGMGLLILAGCASRERLAAKPAAQAEQLVMVGMVEEQPMQPPPAPTVAAMVVAESMPMGKMAERDRHAYAPPMLAMAVNSSAKFPDKEANRLNLAAEHPVSTFSVDVDTASYAYVRHMLTSGVLPQGEAVRVEEMVNYFPYKYAAPASRKEPFAITTELMPSPWKAGNQLVHIAIRGYDIPAAERPRANIVLLIDVSGSMYPPERLPLLQKSFRLFAAQLREQDRLAIVSYANGTRVVLEPTPGSDKQKIVAAIDSLSSGGGTAGADGLQRAYALAERNFDPQAVNRVVLATDGDFNIGISDPKELEKFIVAKRKTGIYLSVFGVGEDNLNDALIQRLTQSGNGNAAYIDSVLEARKAMGEEFGSTMFPIANDVKVQVEFNPNQVAAYRLVGYETRMLLREDFKDDKVDAGDMGAGHTVTAIYEITPASAAGELVDPLRYRDAKAAPARATGGDELCFIKLRYKLPGETASRLAEHVVHAAAARKTLAAAPDEQRFAVAVAAFAQRLRGEKEADGFGYGEIAKLANGARGADPEGYRAEFVKLVRVAETLM